eukprot:gene1081-4312_t
MIVITTDILVQQLVTYPSYTTYPILPKLPTQPYPAMPTTNQPTNLPVSTDSLPTLPYLPEAAASIYSCVSGLKHPRQPLIFWAVLPVITAVIAIEEKAQVHLLVHREMQTIPARQPTTQCLLPC